MAEEAKSEVREEEEDAMVDEVVEALNVVGSKLVCIDFDATFLTIHTNGQWDHSAQDLFVHVRTLFLKLVPKFLAADLHVAVVTFSPQVDLIRQVLDLCFAKECSEKIIIRGSDDSWKVNQQQFESFILSERDSFSFNQTEKIYYIVSAANEVFTTNALSSPIRNNDTVLIDDDPHNIRSANDHGIAGIYFEPEDTDIESLCKSIKKLQVLTVESPELFSTSLTPSKIPISSPESDSTPANNDKFCGSKRKKFNFCTPSPVMKLKYAAYCGKPKSKRANKLKGCSRNIEESLGDLQIAT